MNYSSVEGLKFRPWIGENYFKSPERLLLLGESHYIEEQNTDDKHFTQRVIENHLANDEMKTPFFKKIELLFDQEEPEKFWQRVAFANLIQKGFSSSADQPGAADIATVQPAFEALLNHLKPNKVLVLSKRMWNFWLPETACEKFSDLLEKSVKADVWKYNYDGGHCFAMGIKHPSRMFGNQVELWKPLIKEFLAIV